jgi:hypothetical protein
VAAVSSTSNELLGAFGLARFVLCLAFDSSALPEAYLHRGVLQLVARGCQARTRWQSRSSGRQMNAAAFVAPQRGSSTLQFH